jgi:uncharacterized protein (DUF433 family)
MKQLYTDIIQIDPNIRFGKPTIKGTRICVYDVLGWLASGMTKEDIIKDFSELSLTEINACLAYAADREHTHKIAS